MHHRRTDLLRIQGAEIHLRLHRECPAGAVEGPKDQLLDNPAFEAGRLVEMEAEEAHRHHHQEHIRLRHRAAQAVVAGVSDPIHLRHHRRRRRVHHHRAMADSPPVQAEAGAGDGGGSTRNKQLEFFREVCRRKIMRRLLFIIMFASCTGSFAYGQFIDDALRFSTPGISVGARALGMGGAYTGVANDYSALYWNPAGLAQLQYGEFSFGLSLLNNGDQSGFLSSSQSLTTNALKLNTLGLAYPVPVKRGSLVLAFGYTRQSDFTTGVSFSGFNSSGSIIQLWAPDGRPYPQDITIAEDLKLAYADTTTGLFNSPIKGQLTQLGKATEEGGLNNWSAGAAIDVAKNFSLGLTLTYVSGTYKYSRSYKEQDTRNVYSQYPFDFDELTVEDDVESDLSGVNATFGLMYRDPDRFRFGVTVKTPTSFNIKETFNTTTQSRFDNGDVYGPFDDPGSNKYTVVTPWVFGAGASVVIRDLVVSGDVEYTDWTQTEFQDANQDLLNKNRDIKNSFRPTANLRGGLEYEVQNMGLRLRGGFMYRVSPFQGDPSSFDQKYVTAGLGIPLGESAMLDLGYAHGWWNTYRSNYAGSPQVNEKINTNNFLATVSARF